MLVITAPLSPFLFLFQGPKPKQFCLLTKVSLLNLFADCEYSPPCSLWTAQPSHCLIAKARQPPTCPFPLSLALLSGQRFLFFTRFVRLSRDKDLTRTRLGPEPRKSFNRPIRTGADPCAAIRETRAPTPTPCLSQPLLRFRLSTN